jgi:thiol-disulfide isomerase/thioredoxin
MAEWPPSRTRWALIIVFFLLILGAGVAIFYGLGFAGVSKDNRDKIGPEIGAQAPDFELERINGGTLRLSDLRGRPVLVNFWATWCGPCILEMPNIQKYYEKYSGQFEVVAVNADESQRSVDKFVKDIGVTFPVVLDPGLKIQALYRPRGLPTTFIIDAEGRVRTQHIGLMSENKLAQYLEKVGVHP